MSSGCNSDTATDLVSVVSVGLISAESKATVSRQRYALNQLHFLFYERRFNQILFILGDPLPSMTWPGLTLQGSRRERDLAMTATAEPTNDSTERPCTCKERTLISRLPPQAVLIDHRFGRRNGHPSTAHDRVPWRVSCRRERQQSVSSK